MICQNYSSAQALSGRNYGGITSPNQFFNAYTVRGWFTKGQYDANIANQLKRDSFPTGTNQPYTYIMGPSGGMLTASTTFINSGNVTGNVSQGINIEGSLSGIGQISTANLALVVALASGLVGSGNISAAALVGTVALASTLTGTGNVTAGLNVIAFMQSTLSGTGTLTADLKAKLYLAATIYVNQSEATVQQLVDGVWDAIISDHNNPNTMGEIMNNLGSVADPWGVTLPGTYAPGEAGYILGNLLANIPDSVWDELKTTHTTASSYGKIVQDLELLAKQIKALTSANL